MNFILEFRQCRNKAEAKLNLHKRFLPWRSFFRVNRSVESNCYKCQLLPPGHNLCQQLLCQSNVEPTAWLFLFSILLSCSPHRRISTLESRAGSSHLATHAFTYPDLLSFLRIRFIAKQIYLLFSIKFYVNRLNDYLCNGLESINFKLQAPTTRAQGNNVFRITTRHLLPSRWASWGDMRPSSRDLLCYSCPIQRM
jgi:hypothetical protein